MTVTSRLRTKLAALLGVALLLAGCTDGGFTGLYNAPLPGGADVGDDPVRVRVEFTDVLDLVPQSSVKVDDVTVGTVQRIDLAQDSKSAVVELTMRGDVQLPANARAELRQSSLLGEKFVELSAPTGEQPTGRLSDGATIPLQRTSRNPEVEEVLGALSLLLNGGGVEQLREIVRELNKALAGNDAEFRALLTRADRLAAELDSQRGEIVRAIDGMNRLSETLVAQEGNLVTALEQLEPGLGVVSEQREQLVGMLSSLEELSRVGARVVNRSSEQLVANLESLGPVLDKLAESGSDLPEALRILPTYPLPHFAGSIVRGDYANVKVRLDMNLDTMLRNILNAGMPMEFLGNGSEPDTGGDDAARQRSGDSGEGPFLPLPPSGGSPGGTASGAGGFGDLLGSLLGGTP
ncbi:MCE family protein [Saccharomonospora amisosensis]|uniref:MCE family protein n=1 Tax=Saccharomonospora amisosensis TaxID=1128677 RepID=UPI0014217721|nr:MCE family protein [Saccharomonospora amisosensis]